LLGSINAFGNIGETKTLHSTTITTPGPGTYDLELICSSGAAGRVEENKQ